MATFVMTIGKANIERRSAKAILLNGRWLPLSQVEVCLPEEVWKAGTITMPLWLAFDKWTKAGVYAMCRAGNSWVRND